MTVHCQQPYIYSFIILTSSPSTILNKPVSDYCQQQFYPVHYLFGWKETICHGNFIIWNLDLAGHVFFIMQCFSLMGSATMTRFFLETLKTYLAHQCAVTKLQVKYCISMASSTALPFGWSRTMRSNSLGEHWFFWWNSAVFDRCLLYRHFQATMKHRKTDSGYK